jgi:hypothetical protein
LGISPALFDCCHANKGPLMRVRRWYMARVRLRFH